MNVHVYIQNGQTVYEPAVKGSITWETQRKGQPGKCSFSIISDGKLKIEEGNAVRLDVNGTPTFSALSLSGAGAVTERSRSRLMTSSGTLRIRTATIMRIRQRVRLSR